VSILGIVKHCHIIHNGVIDIIIDIIDQGSFYWLASAKDEAEKISPPGLA
jgi:hypothetical protein